MRFWRAIVVAFVAACGSSATTSAPEPDASVDASAPVDAAMPMHDAATTDAPLEAAPPPVVDTLSANRDRLLALYLAYLKTTTTPQSNGLSSALGTTCDLWNALVPSPQAVFLTLTARLQGSHLADGSSMLVHVDNVYRIAGGTNSTASDAGDCGGEGNRMIVAMDQALQTALVAANIEEGNGYLFRLVWRL